MFICSVDKMCFLMGTKQIHSIRVSIRFMQTRVKFKSLLKSQSKGKNGMSSLQTYWRDEDHNLKVQFAHCCGVESLPQVLVRGKCTSSSGSTDGVGQKQAYCREYVEQSVYYCITSHTNNCKPTSVPPRTPHKGERTDLVGRGDVF